MATVDYPSTLPGPDQLTTEPKVRARSSGLPGVERYTAPERDYYGTLSVNFFFSRDQAAIFKAWWDTNKGYWFNAVWPRLSPALIVYRILGVPTFNHVFDGAYRVSMKVELRGISLAVGVGCTEGPGWATMTPVNRTRFSLVYGNGRFVSGELVSGNAAASWSTSGVSWTPAATSISSSGHPMKVTFGDGLFYGAINAIQCGTSTDGDTWVDRPHTSFISVAPPWYGGGVFMETHGSAASTMMTPNGLSFTTSSTPAANLSTSGGCYGAGVHVVWGPAGACYSTNNGVSWTAATVPGGAFGWTNPGKAAFGNGIFVLVGNGAGTLSDRYRYSDDGGVTWNLGTLPMARDWAAIIFTEGLFLACCRHASSAGHDELVISADGRNWQVSPNKFVLSRGFNLLASSDTGIYVALSTSESSMGEVGVC